MLYFNYQKDMVKEAKTKLLNPTKIKMSRSKALSYVVISAFTGAFSSYFFIIAAHLYTPGLGGISNGIAYVINDIVWWQTGMEGFAQSRAAADTLIYWIVYGLSNIPIIIFALNRFSKRFMGYSIFYFVVNFAFMMLFSNIPSITNGLISEDALAAAGEVANTLTILFFSLIGGIISGISVGFAFKAGACTMGLDPVIKHITRTKDINIAPIFGLVAITTTTTFIFIRALIPSIEVNGEYVNAISQNGFLRATLFSPEYIGSWIFILAYTAVAGAIYSSSKKVEVFATSVKTEEISEYFNSVQYHRGHTIYSLEGGFSKKEKKAIKMIVNIDEMHEVVAKIAAIDGSAFITVKELYRVYDVHNWTTMTDEDKEKEKLRLIKEQRRRESHIAKKEK